MKAFEQPVIEEEVETQEIQENETEKRLERGGDLNVLWKKYHFKGEVPSLKTPVGQRLKDTCARYAKMAVYPENIVRAVPLTNSGLTKLGTGEDYMAEMRQREMVANIRKNTVGGEKVVSDAEKRELHNQIALMTVGRLRTGMNEILAESIADFAVELTYGKTIAQFDAEKNAENYRLAHIASKSKPI